MNVLEEPTRWSRTAAVLGTGALAVAISLGGAAGTASADSPVVDFGSASFSVTNIADSTVYDINVILNLPPGTLPLGALPLGTRTPDTEALNVPIVIPSELRTALAQLLPQLAGA